MKLTDAQIEYFESMGFVTMTAATLRRYAGNGLRVNQALQLTPGTKRDDPAYWVAIATSDQENVAMELVVSYGERFTDPIACFVTAELRTWKRPV